MVRVIVFDFLSLKLVLLSSIDLKYLMKGRMGGVKIGGGIIRNMRSIMVYSGLNIIFELVIILIGRVNFDCFLDGKLGIIIVFLNIQAHCQIIVSFIVVIVQSQGLLVVINGLLIY